ncbi:MAG: protein BatD, partial [Flavobacteriaceae bacterium]|nr:protein BatD [Flavobacteriaceae bacterium]
MKKQHYILFLYLFLSNLIFAQVSFETRVSKRTLGVNERLRVEFVMNQDGDNFTPPTFAGFNIVSGPSQSINRSWVNGKSTFSKTYTYTLAPVRKGQITIKNASVEIDGNSYKTIPVKIKVTDAVEKPKSEAESMASENIHLVAELSNSNPYYNEAITVTYILYFKDVNVTNLANYNFPKYKDFWNQEIKLGNARPQRGTFRGQNYNYFVLKKTVLYPQKTGKLYIEPMSAEVIASIATSRFTLFGREYEKANIPVTSAKRTVNVKPLPESGKPAGFTGAVGSFDFDVITTKKSLRAGESLQAKVEIRGKGNLKLLSLPKLTTPSALEVYEPERKEQVSVNSSGMSGKVSDNYTIVPGFKGKYPIPAIEFSYFDLEDEEYKTLRSLEQLVDVIVGPTNTSPNNETVTSSNLGANKQTVTGKNQFSYINSNPNLIKIAKPQFFRSNLFWML